MDAKKSLGNQADKDKGSAGTSGSDIYPRDANVPLTIEESLEDDSEVESFPDEQADPEFPALAYCVLNLILIIWGVIGIGVTTSLQTSHSAIQDFLLVDKQNLNIPSSFLYGACTICILTGIVAITCIISESSTFFPIFPQLNGLVVGLNSIASVCAFTGWTSVNIQTYQHLLEADALSRSTGDNSYVTIYGSKFIGYWDKLQRTLRCCGLESTSNWINSTCECIPDSCCITSTKSTCLKRIAGFQSSSSPHYKNLSHLQPYIWKKHCMSVILQEVASLKRDWVSFPIILLLFHLILMFNINYIVVSARSRFNLPATFITIARWKDTIRVKFTPSSKNKKRVRPTPSEPSRTQNVPQEPSPETSEPTTSNPPDTFQEMKPDTDLTP